MSSRRYLNRWVNIYKVCGAMADSGAVTSTSISKHVNLSRQSVLKILKDAETQGYVTSEKEPYRQHFRTVWKVTKYYLANRALHDNLVTQYSKLKQMEMQL